MLKIRLLANFYNAIKKAIIVLFFIIFSQNAYSIAVGNANFNTPTALKSVKSEHFVILYPRGQEKFALLLTDYAEKSLEYINSYFGSVWNPKDFVITITTDNKEFNAYYSFNHCVMFNTISGMEGAIYPQNDFQDVLLHELGHAYILNHLSPVKNFFQKLIGEACDNSLYLNHFVTEGLSVALESGEGAGRLNYPMRTCNMQVGVQNGMIYNYRQASGADAQTKTGAETAYMLGGAFFDYLRRVYGIEKFHKLIEGLKGYISFPQLVYDVYGISLNGVFNNLLASFKHIDYLDAPEFTITPSRYAFLASNGGGLYFYDKVLSKVFAYTSGKIKPIIEKENVRKIAVSSNGTYIMLIVSQPSGYTMILYERNTGRYYEKYRISNVENSAFVKSDYGYEIALYRYNPSSMEKKIEIIDLLSQEKKGELNLSNKNIVSMCEFDNYSVAFILRDGIEYNIFIYNKQDSIVSKLDNPNDYIYSDMSCVGSSGSCKLVLSFAEKENWMDNENLPRLLVFERNSDGWKKTIYRDNLLGGVSEPVFSNDKLFYISDNYVDNKIRNFDIKDFKNISTLDVQETRYSKLDLENQFDKDDSDYKSILKSLKAKDYNGFFASMPFVTNHLLLPIGEYSSLDDFGFGLMNISSESSEQFHTFLSAMYYHGIYQRVQFEIESTILSKNISMVFRLNPSIKFDSSIEGNLHFDMDSSFTFDWKKYFDSSNNFFELQTMIGFDLPTYKSSVYTSDGLKARLAFQYTNIASKGYGYRTYRGFATAFAASINDSNEYFKANRNDILFNPKANFELSLYTPSLLPVRNTRNLTFNLPFEIKLSAAYLYNMQSANARYAAHSASVSLGADIVLFAARLVEAEIDFPLLVKYFVLKFNADVKYDYYTLYEPKLISLNGIRTSFSLSAYFDTSPSIGGLIITRSGTVRLGIKAAVFQALPGSEFSFSIAPVISFSIMS